MAEVVSTGICVCARAGNLKAVLPVHLDSRSMAGEVSSYC